MRLAESMYQAWASQTGNPACRFDDLTPNYRKAWEAAVLEQMQRAIAQILEKVQGAYDTRIHGGMKPGTVGDVWEPVQSFGNIDAFRKYRIAQ